LRKKIRNLWREITLELGFEIRKRREVLTALGGAHNMDREGIG